MMTNDEMITIRNEKGQKKISNLWSLLPDCSGMSVCRSNRIYGEKCTDNIAFHDYFGLDVSLSNDRSVVTIADDRLNDNDALNDDGLNDDERW